MSKKDIYVEKLKAQLDEWSAEVDVLEARINKADAELRAKYQEQLTLLKTRQADATLKLAELQQSAGEAWLELQKGADQAWEIFRNSLSEARKKF